jgi:hypothetical protein
MERSFAAEVKQLALGEGQTLRGEGILAITKALLDHVLQANEGVDFDVLREMRPVRDEDSARASRL